MSNRMRAFIAVKLPGNPKLREIISRLGTMGRAVKPVAGDNLHVTLKFLGDIAPEQTAEISRVVQSVAEPVAPFEVRLVGLGAFPHARRPSVIWAGLQNAEPLCRLAESLEAELEPVGFAPEKRPFHAHLTLARVKSRPPEDLAVLLDEHSETEFGVASIESVELFQSELQRDGPRYTVLASAELAGE